MFDTPDNNKLDISKNPEVTHETDAPKLSLLGEMSTAAANQARTVYNGAAQLGESFGLGHLQKLELTDQKAAPTLSTRWWAQEAGSMAVTLPLILGTHKVAGLAVDSIESRLARQAATATVAEGLGVGRMAMTGALYEGIFKPTDLNSAGRAANGDSLAYSRIKQATEGGLSFAAMRIVGGQTADVVKSPLDRVFSGTTAGATYGIVHEQSQSIFEQGKFAAMPRSFDAAARGAILGTALSGLGMLRPAEASDLAPLRQSGQSANQSATLGRAFAGRDILSENTALKTARDFSNNGQHAEALPHLQKALEAAQRSHGPASIEAANVLREQARSNMFLGNNEGAMTSAHSALEIFQAKFGARSAEAADMWDQISSIHGRAGNMAKSAEALDNSLSIGREAAREGRMDREQQFEFKVEEADRVRRLSNIYEGLGNKERAAQVRQEQTPPEPKEIEPRHE